MAVVAHGIEKDSESFLRFREDYRSLRLQRSTPDTLKEMTPRFQELTPLDQVKALLSLVIESQAPTYYEEWFRWVKKQPGILQTLLFVARTLDPDHDRGFDMLLEYAAIIGTDLIEAGTLSVEERQDLRATFETQLISALANNYRGLTSGLVGAHTVIDVIDGYPGPVAYFGSRAYFMHVFAKYAAMGLELISPEDRNQYPTLR
jgi:hypothetical protein